MNNISIMKCVIETIENIRKMSLFLFIIEDEEGSAAPKYDTALSAFVLFKSCVLTHLKDVSVSILFQITSLNNS